MCGARKNIAREMKGKQIDARLTYALRRLASTRLAWRPPRADGTQAAPPPAASSPLAAAMGVLASGRCRFVEMCLREWCGAVEVRHRSHLESRRSSSLKQLYSILEAIYLESVNKREAAVHCMQGQEQFAQSMAVCSIGL